MKKRLLYVFVAMMLGQVAYSQAQEKVVPNGTDGLQINLPDSTSKKVQTDGALQVNGKAGAVRLGMGLIYDVVAYKTDAVFDQQLDSLGQTVKAMGKLRDFRMLGSGAFNTKRSLSWKFAFMYDGSLDAWLVRESGLTVGIPELKSHLFVGRTKEGFSLIKVMNGHSPWANERLMAIDLIPILADGVKLFGFEPKTKIFWNLGAYNDALSKNQGFSTFASQYIARVGFMPVYNEESNTAVHLGVNLRYGKPEDGKFSAKSRPESNPTPFLITTGTFLADHTNSVGYEAYFRANRFMIGSEGYSHTFYSGADGNHTFKGGNVMFSYFLTGTSRPYKTTGSIFGFVPVRKSVFKGGLGEFEGVLSLSTFNLNSGNIQGGQIWRVTPMINWYMTKVIRLEFIYGFVTLERFGLRGTTQMFESRIQFTVM